MTLCQRKNNFLKTLNKVRFNENPYLIINAFFIALIIIILAYSGIFSPARDNYPVTCIHEKLYGRPCISCGLSHSFSLIVRGRIEEAYKWNIYGLRIFLFFFSQLILRVAFSIFYVKYTGTRKQLILTDCIGSAMLFLISFWTFIINIVSGILFS